LPVVLLFTHARSARGTKTAGTQVTAPGLLALEMRRKVQPSRGSWALLVSIRTSKAATILHTSGVFRLLCIRIDVGHGVVSNVVLLTYIAKYLFILHTYVFT
jgi:hypothetical protein